MGSITSTDAANRELHSTNYTQAMMDWVSVIKGHINQAESATLNMFDCKEFTESISTYADMIDHTIGPWDIPITDPRKVVDVDAVFSVVSELNSKGSELVAGLSPKYPEQNDSLNYFGHVFRDNKDDPMPEIEARKEKINMLDCPDHPEYSHGIEFNLPPEVTNNCIFLVKLDNFNSPRSHLKRQFIGAWWEHDDVYNHISRLTPGDALVPDPSGFSNPYIQPGAVSDRPLQSSQATQLLNNGVDTAKKGEYDFRDNPIERLRQTHKGNENMRMSALAKIRDGVQDVPYTHAYKLQRSTLETLLSKVANTQTGVCDAAVSICQWIQNPKNQFMGPRDRVWRDVQWSSLDPSMESSCLALGLRMFYYETELDVAVNHIIICKAHESLIDAMCPHSGLFWNLLWYGLGMSGKGNAASVIKKMAIPETVKIEGYCSDMSALGQLVAQYYSMEIKDEALDSIVEASGKKGSKGSGEAGNKALSIEKMKLTENKLDSSTLTHDEMGRKMNIVVKLPWHCPVAYIANLGSITALPHAFQTRVDADAIPLMDRARHSAADKNAASGNHNDDDSMVEEVKLGFQQWQAFAFIYGNNKELAHGEGTHMGVLTYTWELVSEALRKMNRYVMDPRAIERARIIARVSTEEGIWYRDNLRPHGYFTNRDVTIDSLLDDKHRFEMGNVCSFSTAVRAIKTAISSSMGNGVTSQITKTVMWMIQQKDNIKYSQIFAPAPDKGFRDRRYNGNDACRQGNNDGEHDPVDDLDLHYVALEVPPGDTGLSVLASQIANHMKQAGTSALTPEQCMDALNEMINYGSVTHHRLDVLFPIQQLYKQHLKPWQRGTRYSLAEWIRFCRRERGDVHFKASDLDVVQKLWRQDTAGRSGVEMHESRYWPQENTAATKVSTRVLKQDTRAGRVYISTAFLTFASLSNYTHEFDKELDNILATVCTTERVIAMPEVSMLDVEPSAPYLPKTMRLTYGPVNRGVTNQRFLAKKFRKGKMKGRANSVKWYTANVPIELQVLQQRFEECCERYATPIPSAHYLLDLDPQAISCIFAPYVLHLLLTESDAFQTEYVARSDAPDSFAVRKSIAAVFLKDRFPDLMRHKEADGVTDVENSADADFTESEFVLCIAHVITEQSYAERMGALRQNMLNAEDLCDIMDELHCMNVLQQLLQTDTATRLVNVCPRSINAAKAMVLADRPGMESETFDMVHDRIMHLTSDEIKDHQAEVTRGNRETVALHSLAMRGSGADKSATSFIDEWRSLKKPGAHGGEGYVNEIRRRGAEMMRVRAERDGWLAQAE